MTTLPDNRTRETQADFGGGLNAVSAPHLLSQDEVASSTNVDYSLEWGGAPARRGSIKYAQTGGLGTASLVIHLVARNYALSTGVWSDSAIPWYAAAGDGAIYTGSGTATPATLASMAGYAGGAQSSIFPVFTQYNDYAYLANGTAAVKSNGTNTYDWLLPKGDTPTVTFAQQGTFTGSGTKAGAFVCYADVFTSTEGTVTASSTSSYFGVNNPVVITTATSGTSSRIVLIGTAIGTNWENNVTFITPPTGTGVTFATGIYTLGGDIDFHAGYPGGDVFGTYTASATATHTMSIGHYGTDYILLGLPDQQSVVTIQRDLSIGDTTFTNYWHSETTPADLHDAATDPLILLLDAQNGATFQQQTQALNDSRVITPNVGRRLGPSIPAIRKGLGKAATAVSISPWGVARGDYKFVGTLPTPDFTNIQAVRLIIEFNTTGKKILAGGLVTYGALGWSLSDQISGISYYQTFARVEHGNIVAEGAPSDPSPAQTAQYAYGMLTCPTVTNTSAGITHRVFYRTGGLLQDAHRVGSCSIASGTATIYDYGLPDMMIVARPTLKRFLWSSWPSVTAGTGLPGVNAVSEPWQARVFVGVQNQLYWSVPGVPSQIQDDVQTTVSDIGDPIAAIIPYGNLVVVNQASVYEMAGSVFEGTNANWSLQRTAARRGSAAPKTCIKTPYGVVLFSFDGISLYRSGYGIDQELDWVQDKIGDLWKGTAASDPAAFKGRIPSLNHAAIFNACAAYKDEKLYLAVPTGTNTLPDTVFVLHMIDKKVWMAQYPFKITSLFWDRVSNRLMAGTEKGTVQQIETGLVDTSPAGTATGIAWSFRTRTWSTPTDLLLENLQLENVGTATVVATVDGADSTLGTLTRTSKGWTPASIQGTIGDRVHFTVNGTQSGTQAELYQAQWEFIPQTPKVTYFATDPAPFPTETYVKTWLADIDCLGTSTVSATFLVNGTAITLTNGGTSTALTGSARKTFELSLPNITVGKTVQAIYQASSPFKYYKTDYEFEAKPFEKLRWLVTYKKLGGATQLDLVRFYAMDIEATGTATVTSTWMIDGTAFTTNTFTIAPPNAGEPTGIGRMYADQVPFPPGGRGYLFEQEISSSQPFRVWRSNLDIDRIGVKGLSRITLSGTPTAS